MSHKLFRSLFVLIFVIGLVALQAPQPAHAAGPWYVSTTGDDNNDCLSPTTSCASINGAIGKASGGETIYVAEGTYTGTGDEVVLIDKDITLSGGWNGSFTTRNSSQKTQASGGKRSHNNLSGNWESQSSFSFTHRLSLANIPSSRKIRKSKKGL